nr:hypothetical protein [Comamonas thiooxydans]
MAKLSKRQLQAALNSLTTASNRAHTAREKIMDHCKAVYGFEPGDVDFDEFIDACDGGCGMSQGMSADEFEAGMRAAQAAQGGEHAS